MEDRETPQIHEYGESKTTRIMMATLRHVTSVRDLENIRPLDFCWTVGTILRLTFKTMQQQDLAFNTQFHPQPV